MGLKTDSHSTNSRPKMNPRDAKIKQIVETTRCIHSEAEEALAENNNELEAAVSWILDHTGDNVWTESKTRKAKKADIVVEEQPQQRPERPPRGNNVWSESKAKRTFEGKKPEPPQVAATPAPSSSSAAPKPVLPAATTPVKLVPVMKNAAGPLSFAAICALGEKKPEPPQVAAASAPLSSSAAPKPTSPVATTPVKPVQSPQVATSSTAKEPSPAPHETPVKPSLSKPEHVTPEPPAACNSEDEYGSSPDYDEELERRFAQRLYDVRGFQIKEVKDDGACMFRAVAAQVYGDEEKHMDVRLSCIEYIARNREHFSQFITEDFDNYLTRKRQPEAHGNHVELQAISEIYGRQIEIFEYDTQPSVTFNYIPIMLSYHQKDHYNLIISTKPEHQRQQQPTHRPDHHQAFNDMKQNYTQNAPANPNAATVNPSGQRDANISSANVPPPPGFSGPPGNHMFPSQHGLPMVNYAQPMFMKTVPNQMYGGQQNVEDTMDIRHQTQAKMYGQQENKFSNGSNVRDRMSMGNTAQPLPPPTQSLLDDEEFFVWMNSGGNGGYNNHRGGGYNNRGGQYNNRRGGYNNRGGDYGNNKREGGGGY